MFTASRAEICVEAMTMDNVAVTTRLHVPSTGRVRLEPQAPEGAPTRLS